MSESESEDAWEPSKSATSSKSKLKDSKALSSHKKTQSHQKTSTKHVKTGVKRKRGRRASGSDSDVDLSAYWDNTRYLIFFFIYRKLIQGLQMYTMVSL